MLKLWFNQIHRHLVSTDSKDIVSTKKGTLVEIDVVPRIQWLELNKVNL